MSFKSAERLRNRGAEQSQWPEYLCSNESGHVQQQCRHLVCVPDERRITNSLPCRIFDHCLSGVFDLRNRVAGGCVLPLPQNAQAKAWRCYTEPAEVLSKALKTAVPPRRDEDFGTGHNAAALK